MSQPVPHRAVARTGPGHPGAGAQYRPVRARPREIVTSSTPWALRPAVTSWFRANPEASSRWWLLTLRRSCRGARTKTKSR